MKKPLAIVLSLAIPGGALAADFDVNAAPKVQSPQAVQALPRIPALPGAVVPSLDAAPQLDVPSLEPAAAALDGQARLAAPQTGSIAGAADFSKKITTELDQPFGPVDAPQSLAEASLDVDSGRDYYASPSDWRDEAIYSIIVDRFSRGPNAKPQGDLKDGRSRHGGDIRGIINKLDYLKNLNVTSILLNPLTLTIPDDDAYHGYWPIHLLAVDPRLGTMADFKELVREAHKRGIRVVLDMVVNHSGPVFEYQGDSQWNGRDIPKTIAQPWRFNLKPVELAAPERFTRGGVITNWDDPTQIVRGDFPPNLRHYATDDPKTQDMLIHAANWWIKEADIDGLRLDAIKHVDPSFRPRFYKGVRGYAAKLGKKNFLLLGEVSSGVDSEVKDYLGPGALTSAYNYPAYRRDNYALHGKAPTRDLELSFLRNDNSFGEDISSRLLRFLDNHDVSRFLRKGELGAVLKTAFAFLFFSTGIPMLYYGTEQAFRQAIDSLDPETPLTHPDPRNREDMFPEGVFKSESSAGDKFEQASQMYRHVSALGALRKELPALRRGAQFPRWADPNGSGLYAFSRIYEGQEVVVAMNTADQPRSAEMWVDAGLTPAGTGLVDRLDGSYALESHASDGGSKITVDVPAHGVRVLVKK